MTIGEKVRRARTIARLTQDHLAKGAGYSGKACVCEIERGKKKPSLDALYRLADVLGLEPGELLDDPEDR